MGAYKARKHAYKMKVGGMYPTVADSALVFNIVQVEIHREQVSYAPQPRH